MNRLYGILFFIFSAGFSFGQRQSLMFEKTWDEYYNNVISYADELPNGDFFLVGGRMLSLSGSSQRYACRMDAAGNILWEKDWGNVNEIDGIRNTIKCADGSYMIVGTGLSGAGGGIGDFEATCIDADGDIRFHAFYDFNYNDGAVDVFETADSCFIISGWGGLTPSSFFPAFVKIDRMGNVIWKKKQQNLTGCAPGYMAKLSDGSFMILGSAGNANSYYAHYDSDGTMLSIQYPFGAGSTPDTTNLPRAIRATSDGGFEILYGVGGYATNHPPYNVYTIYRRYSPEGNCTFSQEDGNHINFFKVSRDGSGFTGISVDGDYFEMQPDGTFDKVAGVAEDASQTKGLYDYIRTRDGGYLGVGAYSPDPQTTRPAFYAVKFAPNGEYAADEFSTSVKVYPNPSMDGRITLSFDMTTEETIQVNIFSADGRLVYAEEIFCPANSHTELPVQLDQNSAAAGVYILEAKTATAVYRQKLMVSSR